MTLPLLPQDDPQGDRRGAALAWAQQAYTYRYDALAPLATIANLPATEHFDIRYNALQLGTMSRISANMGMVTVRNDLEPFQGLQEYEEFYPLLPKPSSLSNHHDDRSFARQRVAGANPMVLRRVIDARELADMDLAGQFTAITGLPSLEAGVASGQLFVADYRMFADTVTGTHGGRPKWLAPAVALFCWRPSGLADRGGLAPVAIRLSPRSVTVTPKDGAAWQAAKTHVQVADANHHEMSTHLGRTHLVMEPFAIATARQLAPNHPLRLLLDPHLRFNLARNALARETLIKQDGPVDRLLAGTLQSSLKIATEAAASWHFENFKLPNELKSRGVDDADLLPDYPYRDDGLLLWDSIGAFAREYVGLYYSSPASVQGDVEVQAWRTEISAQNGGRILGVPEEVATPDALAAILQQIIFTTGPQHSAVNYPQWDFRWSSGQHASCGLRLFRTSAQQHGYSFGRRASHPAAAGPGTRPDRSHAIPDRMAVRPPRQLPQGSLRGSQGASRGVAISGRSQPRGAADSRPKHPTRPALRVSASVEHPEQQQHLRGARNTSSIRRAVWVTLDWQRVPAPHPCGPSASN